MRIAFKTKMAYQTRNTRATRSSQGAPEQPRPPQIVYLHQQQQQQQTPKSAMPTISQGPTVHMPQGTPVSPMQQVIQQAQNQPTAGGVTNFLSNNKAANNAVIENQLMAVAKQDDAGYEDIMDETSKGEEDPNRPKWMKKRKDPMFKVSKKIRRKRMNARLRRLLQPKNAIMVLNELKESVKFTFHEQTNAMQQNFFVVTVDVDGQMFNGQGMSKPAAKQCAAENALKALLLEKMAQNTQCSDTEGDVIMKEELDGPMGPPGADVPPGEEPPLLDEEGKPVARPHQPQPEDDVPWGSLASFALYKLFNDWQSQGTQLPISRPGAATVEGNGSQENRGPAPMKKLPDNPTERHPVMLLNQLRPSLVFNDVSMQGVPPNVVFTMAVTIDGIPYQGMGKNKKEAKKEAAKAALAAVFNIHYDNQ